MGGVSWTWISSRVRSVESRPLLPRLQGSFGDPDIPKEGKTEKEAWGTVLLFKRGDLVSHPVPDTRRPFCFVAYVRQGEELPRYPQGGGGGAVNTGFL